MNTVDTQDKEEQELEQVPVEEDTCLEEVEHTVGDMADGNRCT